MIIKNHYTPTAKSSQEDLFSQWDIGSGPGKISEATAFDPFAGPWWPRELRVTAKGQPWQLLLAKNWLVNISKKRLVNV